MTEQALTAGIKGTADRIGWLRVIVGVGITLLVAGGAAALYAASFATQDEVQGTMAAHQATDGHPTMTRALRDMGDRLIRVEIVQQSMAATQEKMDRKLDQLLSSPPTWRVPLPAAPP